MRVILRLDAPDAGRALVNGQAYASLRHPMRVIGSLLDAGALQPSRGARNHLLWLARSQGLKAERVNEVIAQAGLDGVARRRAGGYSLGMRQRLGIAAAMLGNPAAIMLDEPFNGMDPRQRLHTMDLLRTLAGEGRTILFSSHILEEVERVAGRILVIVAGRLAASGDFRSIRRLMTDRPHTFTLRSSNDRGLASALLDEPAVSGVTLDDGMLVVRAADFGTFSRAVSGRARRAGISLYELLPTDESLESVFSYLVRG